MILAALQQLFGINLGFFYNHLLDHKQARAEGFFFVEGNTRGVITMLLNSFLMECEEKNAWCMLLPHDVTADELAPLIATRFSAICGGFNVYFLDKVNGPEFNERYDYKPYVSHVIDARRAKYYFYPRTRRELCRYVIEELDTLTNPSLLTSSVYASWTAEQVNDEIENLLEILDYEKDNDMNDPTPPANEPLFPHPSMSHFVNVPIDIQTEACAQIMQVSALGAKRM